MFKKLSDAVIKKNIIPTNYNLGLETADAQTAYGSEYVDKKLVDSHKGYLGYRAIGGTHGLPMGSGTLPAVPHGWVHPSAYIDY